MSASEVYAFEYTDCTFESAFGIESLHASKRGAWQAMRRFLWNRDVEQRDLELRYGKWRGKAFQFTAHRVRRVEVLP